MLLEGFDKSNYLDIKDMVVPEPEKKIEKQFSFNPEKEFTEEDWMWVYGSRLDPGVQRAEYFFVLRGLDPKMRQSKSGRLPDSDIKIMYQNFHDDITNIAELNWEKIKKLTYLKSWLDSENKALLQDFLAAPATIDKIKKIFDGEGPIPRRFARMLRDVELLIPGISQEIFGPTTLKEYFNNYLESAKRTDDLEEFIEMAGTAKIIFNKDYMVPMDKETYDKLVVMIKNHRYSQFTTMAETAFNFKIATADKLIFHDDYIETCNEVITEPSVSQQVPDTRHF